MYQSKRLILRNWTEMDLVSLDAMLGDPEVMKFSDTGVLSKSDQRTWLQKQITSDQPCGLPGNLAIDHKRSGQVIGYVSLSKDLTRVGRRDVEIGFRFVQSAWGQGYATEAAKRIMDAANPTDRIVAIVDPNNHRSVKLIRNVGLIYECDVMFAGYDYPDHFYTKP